MKFTAKEIAKYINGEVEGNPDTKINSVAKIEEGQEGALSFLSNMKYEKHLYSTKSSVVIVNRDFKALTAVQATLIRVDNAYEAFATLLTIYEQSKPRKTGIHPSAVIEESARIGEGVYIGAMAYIGENVVIGDRVSVYPHAVINDNTKVGEETFIYSNVTVYHDCIIGKDCIIHAGSVVGSDGFGFAPQADNNYKKIPQLGNVVLEEGVELGANVVIDRATMGSTIIRKGVKLDNMVQIGHNVEVGENTVMAGQTGVAGSTKIGRNCMFGGQVGIIGHINLADGTKAAAQTGIGNSVKEENVVLYGSPAMEYKDYQKSYIIFRKLPELKNRVEKLEEKITSAGEK